MTIYLLPGRTDAAAERIRRADRIHRDGLQSQRGGSEPTASGDQAPTAPRPAVSVPFTPEEFRAERAALLFARHDTLVGAFRLIEAGGTNLALLGRCTADLDAGAEDYRRRYHPEALQVIVHADRIDAIHGDCIVTVVTREAQA